jgi:hypothetical protein
MDNVPPKKVRWADVPDDAPLPVWPPPEPLTVVSKHGIKVRSGSAASRFVETSVRPPTPPPPLKQKPPVKSK